MQDRYIARKVPEITAIFWITKILTTAMGESLSDYFVFRINPYIAVAIGALVFTIALILQFSVKRYIPVVYWLAVAMVAVFGTMAADVTHIQFKVPYWASTILFGVSLIVIFSLWHKSEKTLSIHTINNPKREVFYWLTVLATFALGTAAGDLSATTIGLGYFTSGLLFTGIILIPTVGYYLGLNEVLAFWFAYIMTRPLGASFADWLGKAKSVGALGYGDRIVALVLSCLIIVCVTYMTASRREAKRERVRYRAR